MPQIPFYLVDAFTSKIFGGNPAAVCPLDAWLPDDVLLAMTREHNQSETAFFLKSDKGFELRWFTNLGEIDLCGHATLATAHVIFSHLGYQEKEITFYTRFSGELTVKKEQEGLMLNLPAWMPDKCADIPMFALEGLGGSIPLNAYIKRDYMFVYASADDIAALKPDFKILAKLGRMVCVTAPGQDCDFVSRFFCPGDALEEDPVTGSAHSMLVPYWAGRLGKTKLEARQISARGGKLSCELKDDRVMLFGHAVTYMSGTIHLL